MKFLSITFLIFIVTFAVAQSPHRAPLDAKFVNQKVKKGYIHPPYAVKHNTVNLKGASVLPAVYDLRDIDGETQLTPIRNQNPYGTCWAFGAIASIESCWNMNGAHSFIDLSESHMVRNHGYDYGINDGGNNYMATAYLTSGKGPVYESVEPYSTIANASFPEIDKTTDIPAYVDDIRWLGDNRSMVKQTIFDYGAVATNMTTTNFSQYYNYSDNTYFYFGNDVVNHGVSIVGWNDTLQVTGGSAGAPSSRGAWIVRNSWGTSSNDAGYFYASYECVIIGRETELYNGHTLVTDVDTLFDHAVTGATTLYSGPENLSTTAWAAVKHHADQDVFITDLGVALLEEGTILDISVCQSFDGSSFTDTLTTLNNVFCAYAGYKKIALPVSVPKGDFYVLMKYYAPENYYSLPGETVVEDYVYPVVEDGKMWVSNAGKDWVAGGYGTDYDFDLAIKLYANYRDVVQANFTASHDLCCVEQEVTYANTSFGNADSFVWYVDDVRIGNTSDKDVNFKHQFNSAGTYNLTLNAYKDGVAYSYHHDTKVVDEPSPLISIVNADQFYARRQSIALFGSGADSYSWSAEGYLDDVKGQLIFISPDVDSLWVYMHGQLGECTGVDSVLLRMADVAHDNIEEALELQFGQFAYGLTNRYASVQANEPSPKLDACDSQDSWCSEGGLQNTIWFKFTATASQKASIYSYGFDNQLALYDAVYSGTWEDIVSGDPSKFTILAANDDYNDEDYSAVITEVDNLVEGKTYWVQLDGSSGGAQGEIDIIVTENLYSTSLQEEANALQVVNSPSLFSVEGLGLQGAKITLIDATGKIVKRELLTGSSISWNVSDIDQGFYMISIETDERTYIYKTVIALPWQLNIHNR